MFHQLDRQRKLARAFIQAATRYWTNIVPVARDEICRLRRRASDIPDLALRCHALDMYTCDWLSLEGAAAFAAFTPPDRRATVVRLLVRLQSIYQYTDRLMEEPSDNPSANARQLHMAILTALTPDRQHIDYYAHSERDHDGGYLVELVDRCRALVAELPARGIVGEAVLGQVRRIVFYQSHVNLAGEHNYPDFASWAELAAPTGKSQRWWELAAASGSSLTALALLSAAADPRLTAQQAQAIETLYWPTVGALHTLLDNLIDRAEDAATGQHNLLDHYSSPQEMTERMERLTREAVGRADLVGAQHSLILAGMISLYLSDRQAWVPTARPTAERVLAALGGLAIPAMLVLRARRLAHRASARKSTGREQRGLSACGYPPEDYSSSGLANDAITSHDPQGMTEDNHA